MKIKLKTFTVCVEENTEPYGKNQSSTPDQVAIVAREIYKTLDAGQEHVLLMILNNKNRIVGFKTVSSGGMDYCPIDSKILLRSALTLSANGISAVIVHNHPAGDIMPSLQDDKMTQIAIDGFKAIGMRFLDHIVIGDSYYSYRESRPYMFF